MQLTSLYSHKYILNLSNQRHFEKKKSVYIYQNIFFELIEGETDIYKEVSKNFLW